MPVKVCILTTVHQPFDTRIFHKEAKTLVRSGYKVTLIVPHNKNETVDRVKIIALPKARNRLFRIFFHTWQIIFLALGQRADIYHFHDPELVLVGIVLKLFRKKVIYDVHEDVPKIMNIVEQIGAKSFNKIVVVTPEIARKFSRNKAIILRNFPIVKLIDDTAPLSYNKNKPIIIYAGGLKRVRGIKEIIQAMEYVDNKAELWLLGKWYNKKFKRECENLAGWKQVKDFGFVSLSKVYQYMKIANMGISILYPLENHLKSLPVKHYEYMTCSLPVITSNFSYWKDIFEECALFADPYNPKDIAKKILFLLGDINVMNKMGRSGRKLVVEKYSWEEESKKLLEMYKHIL